jgi:hypothetical protein
MYRIKNISPGKVILTDLGLVLTHGQEVDLDEKFPRHVIEGSRELALATDPNRNNGCLIEVIHKDVIVDKAVDAAVIEAMERRLRRTIANEIANLPKTDSVGTVNELKQKLDIIINAIANGVPASSRTVAQDDEPAKDTSTNKEDVAIQQKLIARLSRNVESRVETKSQTHDSDVKKNADELGDMLGL